jgi:hypothetical protein
MQPLNVVSISLHSDVRFLASHFPSIDILLLHESGIVQLVNDRRPQAALDEIERLFPGAISRTPRLKFELHQLCFVELVREGRIEDAIAFVQENLSFYCSDWAWTRRESANHSSTIDPMDFARRTRVRTES